jgi:hypothetical protein
MALVVRHPIILKYWMGHKIRRKSRDIEARYILPPTPEQLKLYQESYRNIDLTGGTLEERAKQAAKEQLEQMLTPEQKEFMTRAGIKLTRKTRHIKAGDEKKEDCPDSEHCGEEFKQIGESDLLGYLKAGWRITHNLVNGQVIVQK